MARHAPSPARARDKRGPESSPAAARCPPCWSPSECRQVRPRGVRRRHGPVRVLVVGWGEVALRPLHRRCIPRPGSGSVVCVCSVCFSLQVC